MDDVNIAGPAQGDTPLPWPFAATLVLHAETSSQQSWTVTSAINLVRSLVTHQSKVVLSDLFVSSSPIAAALGVDDGPGIVDVLFRGTSFSVVAGQPKDEAFYFLPIGTNPPPAQVIYSHPQWKKISTRLPETRAYLLPCVPSAEWLEYGPIPGFEACIVLNGIGSEVTLPPGARRIAEYLAPPEVRNPGAAAAPVPDFLSNEIVMPDQAEAEAELEEAPSASSRPPPREPVAASPVGMGRPVGSARVVDSPSRLGPEPLSVPYPPPGTSFRRRRFADRRWWIAALGGVVIVAAVLWRVLGEDSAPVADGDIEAVGQPARTPPAGAAGAAGAAGTETRSAADVAAADQQPADANEGAAADGGEGGGGGEPAVSEELPEETALAYSVVIASFSSFNDALTRQRNWMNPQTPYYVAPTTVRGVVYYRVFAGLLSSRSEAEALQDRLVDEGVKDAAGAWDIRPVRLAFRFGTYPERRAAELTVETLMGKGIPAYLVSAAAPIGDSAFHVYAGGYEKAEAAEPLRELIERVGLEAELVERVGILTP